MGPRAGEPGPLVPKSDTEPEPGPEYASANAVLAVWRRQAANILLAATTAAHLPVIVLIVLGYGPPVDPLVRDFCLAAYLVTAATALLRRVEYRARLCVYFIAAYLVVAIANLVLPRGPYAQVGLVIHPIVALVLCGSTAAGVTILASAAILVFAPSLRLLPGVAGMLRSDPTEAAGQSGLPWFQEAVVAAFLAAVMILLDRFYRLLLGALANQSREMHERQRLEREIAAAAEGERRRLGRELHDGVCQQVTAALLHCQVLGQRVKGGGTLCEGDFEALYSLLSETIGDARRVARGLCPLDNDPEALVPALRALARRTDERAAVRCEFTTSGDVRVPDPVMAQHLYRIAQEALSNAVQHANASRVSVELRGGVDEFLLEVVDDGAGLPAALPTGGMGLRTMAYRAQILGGELKVAPVRGGGTCVTCRAPRVTGAPPSPDHFGEQ